MKLSRRITIKLQLTILIFTATLIVLIATTGIFLYLEAEEQRLEVEQQAKTAVNILAQDFVRSSLLKSPDMAVEMVLKLEAFPGIRHALFVDKNNIPILNYTHPDEEPIEVELHQVPSFVVTGHIAQVSIPITYQKVNYGKAFFYFSIQTFNESFLIFLNELAQLGVALLFFSFFIALYFQRFITIPIRNLAEKVNHMDIKQPATITENMASSNEMFQLFRGYNMMVERIVDAQKNLFEQKERLLVTLESIADGVIATDVDGRIVYMNPVAENLTGYRKEEAHNQFAENVYRLIDEITDKSLAGYIDESLMTGCVHFSLEHTAILTKDHKKVAIQSSIAPILDAQKKVLGVVIIFQNVTESRELANQLRHQAMHDPLTGLFNRSEFDRVISNATEGLDQHTIHGLLYLDLDQFKLVNDTSGHTAGDALLIQVATLLRHSVRESDIIARLGGDEFAVFLPHCSLQQTQDVAEKIRQQISEFAFVWEDKHFKVGVSIGVVAIDATTRSSDQLLRAADLACYAAKDLGRNRIHIYQEDDQELIQRHGEMHWVAEIDKALDENRLKLFAQHIRSMVIGNNCEHIELLVRYQDEDGVMHFPGAFLPAVERYGLAPRLDRWVIEQALSTPDLIERLRQNKQLRVNINLSGITLSDPEIVEFVKALLNQSSLPPRSICFEITETAAVANLTATSHFMRAMKLLGCEFALDDFGVGVSSFAYLKNLPVDYLKIDGSFINDIDKNPINKALVGAINEIGHVMKIQTVAEFVHSNDICCILHELNIDYAQGYFIHKPCPLNEVYDVLTGTPQPFSCSTPA